MSQRAEIAKALAIAAMQAQPRVFDQDPKSSSDADRLGREIADLFKRIYADIASTVPDDKP